MTTEYRPQTIAMLRAIQEHGPVTIGELEDHLFFPSARKIVVNLQSQELIVALPKRKLERLSYEITRKGLRLLATMDGGHGEVAGPRQPVSTARYTGEAKTQARPGSMIAFTLPSRVGDATVERRRPMLIGSTV
jgi:hypothetical protein